MKTSFRFDVKSPESALVIAFPPGVRGLFNPEVHRLVREVQETLEGVYVTYALSPGNSPDLRSAIAGAKFAGCASAVVVPVGGSDVVPFTGPGPDGDWLVTASPSDSGFDAPAVIDAYQAAVVEAGRAA